MPRVSFTQEEIDALRGAVISRETELGDRLHDEDAAIRRGEADEDIPYELVAAARGRYEEMLAESFALDRAARKLTAVAK